MTRPWPFGSPVAQYSPPVRDARFWVVQGLVVLIFVVHQVVSGAMGTEKVNALPHLVIDALYLIPVLYAALNFNLPGALATAAWVTVLIVVDVAISPDISEQEVVRHAVMLGVIDVVAAFVGVRVNAEKAARIRLAEAEARYRSMFEANSNPVLVLDETGTVREANPAASTVLGLALGEGPARLDELVGPELAEAITTTSAEPFVVTSPAGLETVRAAARSRVTDPSGEILVQVVLQDVTAEAHRREQAETYAAALLQAQEDERRRLAQELHDDTVQELIHLCRQIDGIDPDSPPGTQRDALEDARALAEGIVAGVRDVARGLRPPALDDLGLAAALRHLASDSSGRSGVPVQVDVEDPGDMAPALQLVLFRVAQEALNNIERHAQARTARLRLVGSDDSVTLEVADDGSGFSAPADGQDRGGGLGLTGMAERARLVDGTLTVDSAPGRGTTVVLSVPRRP